MTKPCRPIHPYGPAVGKFTVHGTVEMTIAKERKRLRDEAERQAAADAERAAKVKQIVRERGK